MLSCNKALSDRCECNWHAPSDPIANNVCRGTFPRIPGHEVIGTVVAVGPDEKKWKIGDKVGGPWHGAHDGTCKACNRGLFQMCENGLVNGVNRDGGCMCLFLYDVQSELTCDKTLNTAPSAPKPSYTFPMMRTLRNTRRCCVLASLFSTAFDK
jgi:D-arabinose 1-dehydrogenase-like Zn-dependent alcohol dehydrogenase